MKKSRIIYLYERADTMEINDLIKKINALAKKKREDGLSEEETKEQKELYTQYLSFIKGQVKSQLDNIEIVDDNTKPKAKH